MAEDSESEWVMPVESELSTDKIILKDFIFNLEALPELWDLSAKAYSDKIKRAAAQQKLLKIYKKIKPTATVDDVRKKINSLRSNYRKELKRIVDSKRSGAGADDVYTPKSWAFKILQFLEKTEKPVNVAISEYDSDSVEMNTRSPSLEELDDSSFSSVTPVLPPRKKPKVGYIAKQNELIDKACSLLSEQPASSSSKVSATAIYWSEKLEKLQPKQRLFAEKAINDILFEAELGTLNRNSVQINKNSASNVTSPEPCDAQPTICNRFVPVSSDANIFSSTPSPRYVFVSQSKDQSSSQTEYSRTQSSDVFYQSVGATQDVYTGTSQDISISSLFSSFNGQ